MKTYLSEKKSHTRMLTAALLVIAQNENNPNIRPRENGWANWGGRRDVQWKTDQQ